MKFRIFWYVVLIRCITSISSRVVDPWWFESGRRMLLRFACSHTCFRPACNEIDGDRALVGITSVRYLMDASDSLARVSPSPLRQVVFCWLKLGFFKRVFWWIPRFFKELAMTVATWRAFVEKSLLVWSLFCCWFDACSLSQRTLSTSRQSSQAL